jgi:hypothetical protein
MRAEALSWDDWSVNNAPPIVEDDKWHVALAPGEVKIVSLEQLDDLFRLSIVDAETKVWQTGMSEWQPLRVIAGIDDEPAPEPKRSHPKPPSPRSAAPPPRPKSVAPAPAYAAPVSFALAPTEPSYVSPVAAVNQFASVRPLVVSQAPRPAQRGGSFGRFLVGLAVVTGIGISLYRNGIVREAASSLHRDALYARLETALGGPAFGTLRAVEQNAAAAAALHLPETPNAATLAPASDRTPVSAAVATDPGTAPNHGGTPPVVSLESLTTERAGSQKPKTDTTMVVPAATPKSVAQKPEVPVAVKAAPAKAAPIEKAQPAAPEKPESEMTPRERLNAAIGRSMLSSPPTASKASKSKGAKGNSDYDPLNPKL